LYFNFKKGTLVFNRQLTHVNHFCEVRWNFTVAMMTSLTELKGGDDMVKKRILVISIMLALAIAVGGCATKGDLEEVQAREKAIGAKADQAAQDAEAARVAADEAVRKAEEAVARAEEAERRAEERERIAAEKERLADEKAKKAEEAFEKSMKK
jgi:murein lipoprotein